MLFRSTRGDHVASFREALSFGYAFDGGLFMPEEVPVISAEDLAIMKNLSYTDLFIQIATRFAGDEIPAIDLRNLVMASFGAFACDDIVAVVKVGQTYVAELYHGPTYAFKDFGQQALCRFIDYFAQTRNKKALLIVSTTGDTGPAAIRAVEKLSNLNIICFYPSGQVSALQEQQMVTVDSPSVHVYTFEGGGDDMDEPIKSITTDPHYRDKIMMCSVNSINFGRIMAQVVHYFYAYLQVVKRENLNVGDAIDFALPCGALGNATAGLLAKAMGLPIRKMICGNNDNDILHRALSRGDFTRYPEMKRTLSEAINIQVPYNFERILSIITKGDSSKVKQWMSRVSEQGGFQLDDQTLAALAEHFVSASVSDEEMLDAMRHSETANKYLVDPHTAVAFSALAKCKDGLSPCLPCVVLATAHACKFEKAVRKGLGDEFWENEMPGRMPPSALELASLPTHRKGVFEKGHDWKAALTKLVENIAC